MEVCEREVIQNRNKSKYNEDLLQLLNNSLDVRGRRSIFSGITSSILRLKKSLNDDMRSGMLRLLQNKTAPLMNTSLPLVPAVPDSQAIPRG